MKKLKRLFVWMMLAALLTASAHAEYIESHEYTEALTAMTQDAVFDFFTDEEECVAETMQPDRASIDLLNSVYEFVYEKENRGSSQNHDLSSAPETV